MPFPQSAPATRLFIASVLFSFSLSGCGDGGGDATGLDTGSLTATVSTPGSSVDPDGYTLLVDGTGRGALSGTSPVTISGLAAGDHAVGLTGVADNCQVQGDNPRLVSISSGATASVAFVVTCTPPQPGSGSIQLTVNTTGPEPDPDGYTATLDGTTPIPVPATGSATFPSVPAGNHTVTLSGLAANCTVPDGGSASATVSAGAASQVSFTVTCTAIPPSTGTLRITTSTTGPDPDADGYRFAVDGGQPQAIAVNSQVELPNTPAGTHTVVLSNVASNCTADNATKTATLAAGATETVAFTITCAAVPPTVGSIHITTTTTGTNPDGNGYRFAIDQGAAQAIGATAEATVNNVAAGAHTVTLSDIAANCSANKTSSAVSVTAGATATVAFTVTCTAIPPVVGSIHVRTTTTGTNPDDGYRFTVDGGSPQGIGASAEATVNNVATGSHTVALSDVASNCTVNGGSTRTVTVAGGQTAEAAFAIDCSAPRPSASRSTVLANPGSILVATGSSTITVTVKDAGGGPLSSIPVSISATGDGNTITPVSPTTNQEGKATFTFSSTVAGKKTITAIAGGLTLTDTEVITVIMQGSVTDITIAPEPSTPAESFTATVRVSSQGAGIPTGTVNVFSFDLTGGCDNVALNGQGVATCTFPASPAGTYTIQAAYSGDDQFEESSDSKDHVVVAPAALNQRAAR
ncbi:MAG: Ig-like domain repeat protein [Gemmatimonadales bacterium]